MSSIVDIEYLIDRKIDENNYIQSLLFLSLKYNLISYDELNTITFKFTILLKKRIKKYTAGLKSSVSIDIAKSINSSNIYVIGVYLKDKGIKNSLNMLLSSDIFDIYNNGLKIVNRIINKTKLFYNVVFLNNLVDNDNYFYNATLRDGIKGFFKVYNADYRADEIFITVDYNSILEKSSKKGIEFILEYLERINYENVFCNKFDNKNIRNLLNNYDYKEIPINIFEIVLMNSIVLKYLNKDIYSLNISDIDICKIYSDYDNNINSFRKRVKESFCLLKNELSIENEYLNRSFEIILKKLENECENKNLEVLFKATNTKYISYFINNRMNDMEYESIIKLLKQNNNEIDIIKNKVVSLMDIIDIIHDINFSSGELFKIFSFLQIVEIMVLKNYYSNFKDDYVLGELNRFIMKKNLKEQNIINNNYKLINIVY